MTNNRKKDEMSLTLVDAIETLSNIADLQYDGEIGISQLHDLVLNDKELSYRTVHWFREEGADATVNMVKETFRVILNYLKDFYKRKYPQITKNKSVENLKTIMVLVGEAARKLDQYASLFKKQSQGHSVSDLKEYKELQEFYLSHVAKKIDEGTISKWILALSRKGAPDKSTSLKGKRPIFTKHVFIDLESVKKDSEYELFFMKKEDGSRFFSPRLIRNIKLVSDFGSFLGKEKEGDPLQEVRDWQDEAACANAKDIMRSMRSQIEKYYKTVAPSEAREHELIDFVNKALIALMMAVHPVHDAYGGFKNCWNYFHDFQVFLRRALQSTEYQKLMAYSTNPSSKQMNYATHLIHFICLAIYTQLNGYQTLSGKIHELIHKATENLSSDHKEAFKDENQLWVKLAGNYAAVSKLLKIHASGPLNKILTMLEEGECHEFDPVLQENLPSQLFSLYFQGNRVQFARWPAPAYQEFIHKAVVNDEFKAFLQGCAHEHIINKVLLFNFQDRTIWKEQARSKILEDLPNHESFTRHIEVVTLDKDTEFYHQLGPYAKNNHADVFIKQLKAQIESEENGYAFPLSVRKELQKFIPETIEAVHRIFFSNKNILMRENRLDFIEIFYLFLQLKIIEYLKPDIVGFSCKDGLDTTCAAGAELFTLLKFLNQEHLSENDQDHLDLMLYGPCLITRERAMMPEKFNRMVNAIKAIESARDQIGKMAFAEMIQEIFGYFYKTPILKGKVVVQSSKDIF
jgi:hypothetical protein